MSFTVDFEPLGRRVEADNGETILDVAQRAGILLNAVCGGEGICGACKVRVMEGKVSSYNLNEEAEFGDALKENWRLACQTEILGDVRVHVPPESLVTTQRTQTEGRALSVELEPAVRAVDVELPPAIILDLRSDADRLRDVLHIPELDIPLAVLRDLPSELRTNDYHVSAHLRGATLVSVRPPGRAPLGFAVDLGTTKLAGYLVDLASGETLASAGAMNPQIAFGEDVMARISHAMEGPAGAEQLRSAILQALNDLARDLCGKVWRSMDEIADAVVVGNTAMHHLFLGLPVRQLGLAPYVPAESSPLDIPAREVGLELAPGANLHLLPNIAGFVGADHVAMLLGSGMLELEGNVLGMDIGTNTEISLIAGGRHYSCSTASGPAFEGAHIRHGMRAAPGAIEKVVLHDGQVLLQTIDHQPPVGLCGSGILDLVAQMHKARILNQRGAIDAGMDDPRIRKGTHGREFVLVPAVEGRQEVVFGQSDISEIQLAKGAIRTGTQILLNKAGIGETDIQTFILAGAFGTYLDVESGMEIGMFPRLPRERFVQVGNAAGTGARMALLSLSRRAQAARLAKQVTYVELTAEASFSSIYARSMKLGREF